MGGLARLFLRSDRQMHYLLKFYDETSTEAMNLAKEVKNQVDRWDNKGAVSSEEDKHMKNFMKYLEDMTLFAKSNKASVEVVKEVVKEGDADAVEGGAGASAETLENAKTGPGAGGTQLEESLKGQFPIDGTVPRGLDHGRHNKGYK